MLPPPPNPPGPGQEELLAELESTRARLREAEYLLDSIQAGKAEALVIQSGDGAQVYTLKSLDLLIDSIIEHSVGATLVVDREGTILRASPPAAALQKGEPLGRRFDEAFRLTLIDEEEEDESDDSGPRRESRLFRIEDVLEGRQVEGQEVACVLPDGSSASLLLAAKPLTLFGGLFQGAVVNILDITSRKQAELQLLVRNKQLKYQSELTRAISDNTAEALFLTDVEGCILFMNPGAEEMMGAKLADLLGRPLHAVLHPHHAGEGDAREECALRDLLATVHRMGVDEDMFLRADGRAVEVRYSKAPVVDEGRVTGAVLSAGDVSRRNETEAALKLSEEKLHQSQKMEAVGRLAGGIAHDFNNLLTAINGYSSLALHALPPGDPLHPYLLEIHKAGERAAALTSQLLAYSRKQILAFKLVDMNVLAVETMDILKRTLGENLRYALDLSPVPCLSKADPARIQQVIVNLAINARDAMPRGGELRIATSPVTIRKADRRGLLGEMAREGDEGLLPGDYVRITISDTGHGMDERVKQHLFEPFFTTKEVGKGTGLGLSMAYGIIKQTKGHIQVFSEPGNGTVVHILLPRAREEAVPERREAPEPGRWQGHETVLLAEDEPAVLGLMRHVLRHQGYRVLEAPGGREALELSDRFEEPIDLLITDMVMPGMGGHELAAALKERRPQTRHIFISGYTDDFTQKTGLGAGDTVFLQKPFAPEVLARTVRRALDQAATPAIP